MNLDYIERVIKLVRGAAITELTIRVGTERLTVRQTPLPEAGLEGNGDRPPATALPSAPPSLWLPSETLEERPPSPVATVKAHLVGIFHRGQGPEASPLVEVGDWVEEGETVGMIESMRNLLEVRSPVRGRVQAVLVADGQPVEYGQDLFEVDSTGEPQEIPER